MKDVEVKLTDSEWMDLIDGERSNGLAKCCANISALRDAIINLARDGGLTNPFGLQHLRETLGWVLDSHDISEIPALMKLRKQVALEEPPAHKPTTRPDSMVK